jgi:hypothetical protein
VYRYSELHGDMIETFILESLLPNTNYGVHISMMKLRDGGESAWRESPPSPRPNFIPVEPIR